MTPPNDRYLTPERLRLLIDEGDVDTVVMAFTDMQGRLQGKRLHGRYFLDVALEDGTEGCNYLLAVDIDMNTVDGYAMSSWEKGYGDMEFVPDWSTLRLLTHLPATAMVQCDLVWLDHAPVLQSPRTILQHQLEKVAEKGMVALAGTELEFIAFDTSYEDAHHLGWRDLTPVNQYNVDYSILGTSRAEPLLRDIRNHMYAAGLDVEGAKGECNFGQHEIGFLYADAMTTADNHSVYKTAAKEIAAQRGQSITFMAKYNQREGNSCHIHLSLRGDNGDVVFWDDDQRTPLYDHFIAGVLATLREFTLLYAPNVNSYKRFAAGSFAPTAVAWGLDNRTCAVRLVGHGPSARMENRLPGGDVNPYLALAGMVAGGLHGIENELPLEDELVGNAYDSDKPHVPHTLRDARELFAASDIARCGVRRRRRRPLRQHGRRRARRLRRARDRLGAGPLLRADVRGHVMSITTLINPSTGSALREVPSTSVEETDAAIEHAQEAFTSWRAVAPGERARLLRSFAAAVDAHVEELARLEVENSGHTIGNARWEAGNVRDCLNYYSAAPERLFGRQIPVAGGDRRDLPRASGRRRRDRAVELPDADRRLGFRPGAGRREHGRAEAGRDHPADRDADRGAGARGRSPRRRVHGAARQRLGRRPAVRHPPARAQGLLHRLHRGRQADHGRLRRPGEAGDARARRQEREHRVRGRRRREGRGHGAVRRLRQRRPGLLRALADPRRAVGVRRVRRPPRDRGPRHEGRRPGAGRQRDGPDGLGPAARLRAGLHRRRDDRLPGCGARTATATGCRRPSSSRPRPRSPCGARRSSGRSWR